MDTRHYQGSVTIEASSAFSRRERNSSASSASCTGWIVTSGDMTHHRKVRFEFASSGFEHRSFIFTLSVKPTDGNYSVLSICSCKTITVVQLKIFSARRTPLEEILDTPLVFNRYLYLLFNCSLKKKRKSHF